MEWSRDLSSILQDYLRDDYLIDLVLQCQDGVGVPCHRLVLAQASSLLASWFKEVEDQDVTVVILPDIDSKAVITLVEALYGVERDTRGSFNHYKQKSFGELHWLVKDLGFQLQSEKSPHVIALDQVDTPVNVKVEVHGDIITDVVDNEDGIWDNSSVETRIKVCTFEASSQIVKESTDTFNQPNVDLCPLCSKNKSEHINADFQVVESGTELYKCCCCEWSRLTPTNFLSHIENHIKKKFSCEICCKGFSHKQTMNKHKKVHQKEEITDFNCDVDGCSYISKRKDAFISHVKRVHHKIKNSETKTTCPKCEKEMNKKFFLNYHSKTCSGNIVFQCDICGKSGFVNKITLENHVNSIHIQLKMFDCEHCMSKFSTAMNLSTHRRRMHGVDKKRKTLEHKISL